MPESNVDGLKTLVKAGLDSLGEKNQTKNVEYYICDMLFDDWHSKDLASRLGSIQNTYRIYIKEISPVFGKCAVDKVTPVYIREVLDNIQNSTRPKIGKFVLHVMQQLFDHAIKLNLIQDNPAANFNLNDAGSIEIASERVLTPEEISQSFLIFRNNISSFGLDNYIAASLLLMLGVRQSELMGAKWIDLNLEKGIWNLPSGRSKTGAAISIQLSIQAVAIFKVLKVRSGYSDYVFTPRSASKAPHVWSAPLNQAIKNCFGNEAGNLLRDMTHFTAHNFRRTCHTLHSKLRVSDYKTAHQQVSDQLEPLLNLKQLVHGLATEV